MARIYFTKFSQRRKKWEHFKLRTRHYVVKLSLLINLYFAYKLGYLNPILEQIIPLINKYL